VGKARGARRRSAALAVILVAGVAAGRPALAQTTTPTPRNANTGEGRDAAGELYRLIGEILSSIGSTRGRLFDFFETIELWDAEAEIDRLVGSPWELHDSTDFKLRLLPLRLAYPTYGRLADQMTGLDDRRGLRIQNLGVDDVDDVAVPFQTAEDLRPVDFANGLLGQFSVREFADLGVFALSHQPFFPQSDEGWQDLKHRLARSKVPLVGTVLGVGALFNAGAFSTSGSVAGSRRTLYGLGWYGGVRRVGRALQPQFRAGFTARSPGLEAALGVREQINPSSTDARRWAELAVREGWLTRVSRPSGWDAFFEGALRRMITVEPQYAGEQTTGRLGIFARHDGSPRMHYLVFRSSAELETDFLASARFVFGIGLEHPRSGLATLIQSSRTAQVQPDGTRVHELRTGLFVAGTVEPPNGFVIDAMNADARRVREEWDALVSAGDDQHLARLAEALATYLESRRRAYTILHWDRPANDLYGPLDGPLLVGARRLVGARFESLAATLEDLSRRIAASDHRAEDLRQLIERERDDAAMVAAYRAELQANEKVRRAETERVGQTLVAYRQYRSALARIASTSPRPTEHNLDPLPPQRLRRLVALATAPL
jgi:hypothetical protein